MHSIPCLYVYFDSTNRVYLIQNYMEHPDYGYSMATGDFIRVDAHAMQQAGIYIILKHLQGYTSRCDSVPSPLKSMTPEQSRKFHKEHRHVVIDLEESQKISITPMEVVAGEDVGRGVSSRIVEVQLSCDPQQFFRVLNEALGL